MMGFIENFYKKYLIKILRVPKTVLAIVLTLFFISVFVLLNIGGEFIPALEEGDFAVETRVLTGTNLTTTIQNLKQAAHLLKSKFPEVVTVVSKIGSGEVPTDPMPMEAADMMVILKDKKEWTSAKTFPELANKMSAVLNDLPGITTSFQFPVQMRFNELMTGAKQDVVCKIYGDDLDTLAYYATKLGAVISSVKGAQDVYLEPVMGMPQIVINYHRNAIAQYNLSVEEVNMAVNTAFAGQVAGLVYEGDKRFELILRLEKESRTQLADIQNLLIPTSVGNQIPLHLLASVDIINGPNQIQREDAKRRIIVGFNVRDRDVQSTVEELQAKVGKSIKFPATYFLTYGGSFENLNQAKARLAFAVPVSLVLIFLLLYFAFNSIKHGLLIYSAIPLSAIGGIYFLALRGMPFSISAGVGFIALFGVAVLNGIVLIAEFNRLKAEGFKNLCRLVIKGTKIRLRPVLMTAFVASLGFFPMAISNGAGAEVQRPLATVVIGGLLLATFLTLFVLPILYILFESIGEHKSKFKESKVFSIGFLLLCGVGTAQNISLQAALDSAYKNNLSLRSQVLLSEYKQKLIGTAANLQQASVNTEYGQFNSSYADTRFGISQSLSFPSVYANQRKVLKDDWLSTNIHTAISKADLKRKVTELFYEMLLLREKEKILKNTDSLFTQFIFKANLRFEKGESNVLEKTSAQIQQGQIQIQLNVLKSDLEINQIRFQLLLNSKKYYEPNAKELILTSNSMNTNSMESSLWIKLFEQQVKTTQSNLKLEKTKFLPEINLGYYNQSMRGTGADDKFYTANQRFNTAQLGIGIPLFFGSQKAKVTAYKTQNALAENELLNKKMQMQSDLAVLQVLLKQHVELVNYYEKVQLPQSVKIVEAANKQYNTGEINYMDWILLINQSILIQSNHIDAIKKLNETIIQINYLTSN